MRVGTWPPCPPPHPCGPRSLTGEPGAWRVLRGPACRLLSSRGLALPPPGAPGLNPAPPPTQELLPSALPGAQALHLHQELVAGPAPPPLQRQRHGPHRRQAGQGQAGGAGYFGGASPGLGASPCGTQGSLPGSSPWGGREAGGEDCGNSPGRTSVPVPAPMSQEWAEGPRATSSGVWESWPVLSCCSLESAGQSLSLRPALPSHPTPV